MIGRMGQKNHEGGQNRSTRSCQCSTWTPFKTAGPDGIRPGGLPRWLELLTKLAAILDLGVQSRLARTPPPGQVEPPFQLPRWPICPKSIWGVERTASTRWISISVARSRPGGPRWTQVAFLEHLPGGVQPAKKSYRTYPEEDPADSARKHDQGRVVQRLAVR
jgi:hypothetical protein